MARRAPEARPVPALHRSRLRTAVPRTRLRADSRLVPPSPRLSLLHSSTSIAIMLADPLHGFLAARKLSTELCFFDLFKNLVEARARGQSHGDQIPTP